MGRKFKFNAKRSVGGNRENLQDNIAWELQRIRDGITSLSGGISAFQSEYGAGEVVRDASTKDPFILIIQKNEVTGVEEQCALYPGGGKVCPAPTWEVIDDANANLDWERVCYDDSGTTKNGWLVRETISGVTRIILEEEDGTFITDTAPYGLLPCAGDLAVPVSDAKCFAHPDSLNKFQQLAKFNVVTHGPTITDVTQNGATLPLANYPYDPTLLADRNQFVTDMLVFGYTASITFDAGDVWDIRTQYEYASTAFELATGAAGSAAFIPVVGTGIYDPKIDYIQQHYTDGSSIIVDVANDTTIPALDPIWIPISCDPRINELTNYTINVQGKEYEVIGDQALTVSSTAVQLTLPVVSIGGIPVETVGAVIYTEDSDIRVRFFPDIPTSAVGFKVRRNSIIELGEVNGNDASEISTFRAIRRTGVDANIFVIYYKRV